MIGAKDLAFPKLNLAELVHLHPRRAVHALRAGHRRRRHRLDVLHAVQHASRRRPTSSRRRSASSSPASRRSSPASTSSSRSTGCGRPGMTWFRLPLFLWSIYATSLIMVLGTPVLAITILLVAAERLFHFGIFDPARRRRPGAVPAPVLVLLAPGGLHHGAAGDGRRQRAGRRVLPQAGLRLHVRRVRQPRRSPSSASSSGATTCSSPASRSTPR